jgi:2-haloalkanoic acid dehalogenase type II
VSVRAACFDLLSALLDSGSLWDGVAASLGRADLGRPWRGRYLEITSTVGGYRPYLALVGQAAHEVGLPEEAAARLERAWDQLRPWPDVPAALGALEIPAAVVTNCSLSMGRRAAACVGARLDAVITAEEAGAYKPDPAPYRLACEQLGHAPHEVAFVAGSPFDARGALAFGFQVTWVNRLAAPVPAELSRVQVVSTLERWRSGPDHGRRDRCKES